MDITELRRMNDSMLVNRHPWELARKDIIHFLFRSRVNPARRVADVGSGDAFILKTLAVANPATNFAAIDTADLSCKILFLDLYLCLHLIQRFEKNGLRLSAGQRELVVEDEHRHARSQLRSEVLVLFHLNAYFYG